MAEDDPTMEIDRSDTWVKARQDENGNYLDDDVKTIAENIELDVSGCVKKKLDLVEDQNVDEKNEKVEDVVPIGGGDNEIEILLEKSVKDDLGCSEWLLAVGNTSNVVAYATMETDVPSGNQILHGVPVAKENARVSITRGVKKNGAKKMKNVKDCVDAIKIYKDKAKKMLKKKIIWENLAWLRRGNNTFNDDDVNDIKNSWAKFFLKHHT
ncbi:hypothetical protein ACET3Z_028898 [Daucus carota]